MGKCHVRYGESGVVMHQAGTATAIRQPQSPDLICFNVGTVGTAAAAMDQ